MSKIQMKNPVVEMDGDESIPARSIISNVLSASRPFGKAMLSIFTLPEYIHLFCAARKAFFGKHRNL